MSENEMGVVEESSVLATIEPTETAGSPDPQLSTTGETPAPGQAETETEKDQGLLADLISKRRENAELKRKLAEMENPQQQAPELRDDDIATVGDLKKFLEHEKRSRQEQDFSTQYQNSLKDVARNNDFQEKMKFLDELMVTDPSFDELDQYVLSRPNGPQFAYQLAKRLMSEQKSQKAGQVSQKLDRNLASPPPLTGGSASPVLDESQRIKQMKHEDFDALVRKVEGYS